MSAEVRQRAIDPAISCLVQAPAGSGKTELLTQRVLALLAVVDEPEEILALTFTRKAAAEMRSRVIDALTMARPTDSDSHKVSTWQLAQKAIARSQQRGWNLAEHPARLRIMTLDSLTGSLARQLPLLSGFGDIPTPSEHSKALCREAAESTLNRAMRKDSEAVETLLLHHDHNSVAVIEAMVAMLESRDQWIGLIAGHRHDTGRLKQILETNLNDYLNFRIQACNDLIPIDVRAALPPLIRFAGRELNDAALLALAAWPDAHADHLAAWKSIADLLLTAEPRFRKRPDKNCGFPTTAKEEKAAFKEILDLLDSIPGAAEALHAIRALPDCAQFDAQQWQVAEALFELLPEAVVELKSRFSAGGEADFTEIALRALDALVDGDGNPSDLLLKLDYRINHILVDEFQDTSELQMRLMQCLTAGWQLDDGRTLFMVGDPMQSIYRFRKAEVGLFLQAAANRAGLPPVQPLKLERNFRSARDVVAWVNRAFAHIFPAEQDAVSGAIAYTPAAHALPHAGSVRLHRQIASGDSVLDDAAEAQAILSLVESAIAQNRRVGILARTRKHLHAVIHALGMAGIAHRAINLLPLSTRPEIRSLRTLVRALLHPADQESWLGLLRAAFCGLTSADIFALLHGDERNIREIIRDEAIKQRLSPDACARVRFVAAALEPCLTMSGKIGVRELAESACQRLNIPALLNPTERTNVETLLNLIETLDEGGRIDFELFDERIEQLFAAPDASDAAANVELLTMHGAKGLQWDTVILPGLGKAPKNSDQPLLAFTDAPMHGKPLFLMSPKAETRSRDMLYNMVCAIEKTKESHELARLLYVACTRAERELHMFGTLSQKEERPAKGSPLALLLADESCFGAEEVAVENVEQEDAVAQLPLRRVARPQAFPPGVEAPEKSESEYAWAGPEAAPVGNALHAMLQRIGADGIEAWHERGEDTSERIMQRHLIAEGLSGAALDSALARCMLGLKTTLQSKMGRWILSGRHSDAHCEWELCTESGGQLRQRFIDRTFIDDNGVRWIIDYKSGAHEGANLNSFLDSEAMRYRDQLSGYRELLKAIEPDREIRCALYFPLFDGWREITDI